MRRQTTQTAHDVRDMAAEDPPEEMQLVEDDELEPGEKPGPACVVREDPAVEHLRVRQHDGGVPAGVGPLVASRVAVVGRGHDARQVERGERTELVVGECLRGVDADGRARPIGEGGLADGGLVDERLPGRRAGGHGDRSAGPDVVERLDLVGVEPLDREPVAHRRGQGDGELAVTGRRRRQVLDVDEAARVVEMGLVALGEAGGPEPQTCLELHGGQAT